MRRLFLIFAAWGICSLSFAQQASPGETEELLNSERIFQQFGSYGVELVTQEGSFRQTSLYSEEPNGRVTRTFAAVQFVEPINPEIKQLHKRVLDGASIGSTFKAAGWQIQKSALLIDERPLPLQSHVARLMHLDKQQSLAQHVYLFTLSREGAQPIDYALIAELHHPDYLTADELWQLYGNSMDTSLEQARKDQVSELIRRIINL